MTPVIQRLAESRDDVVSINAAEHLDIARGFKVMGTPTLVLVEDGRIRKMLLGAKSEQQILSLLD